MTVTPQRTLASVEGMAFILHITVTFGGFRIETVLFIAAAKTRIETAISQRAFPIIGSPLGGPHSIRGIGKSATGAALYGAAKYGPLV